MRLSLISALFILSSAGNPTRLMASMDTVSIASDTRLQAAMESEFLYQSGQFSEAFEYYRQQPLAGLDAQELRRGIQLARVLGDGPWLQSAADAATSEAASDLEFRIQGFEAAVRQGRSGQAASDWMALNRTGPERLGLLAARDAIAVLLPDNRPHLQSALSAYAATPDLNPDERLQLFEYARIWGMPDTASTLKAGLRAGSRQSSMAELIILCMDAMPDRCLAQMQAMQPGDFDDSQRRSVLAIAQDNGDALQIQRWLKSLPQDGLVYYQRMLALGKTADAAQAQSLAGEIAADGALNVFQRAVLLGSLAELGKDWPAAEMHYREALAVGRPTSAALRLPIMLMRQNRAPEAYAQLQAMQDNTALSDEIRREAFRTEIQFKRVLETKPAAQDAVYRRALTAWPDAHVFRYQYAMHLFGQNRIEDSLAQLQIIVDHAPANTDALNAYGYLLAKDLNRPRDAFRPIETAYLLAPGQGEILDSYGYVLHRLGRNREALPRLQEAMKLSPSAVTAGHLTRVYLALGEVAEAKAALNKGLELDRADAELLHLQESMR